MLDVGRGGCYLVRVWKRDPFARPWTAVFDCGAGGLFGVGEQVAAPALGALGVNKVDALFLSHADLDHFSGAVGLAKEMPVAQVYVPPPFQRRATRKPNGAAARLLRLLEEEGLSVDTVARGFHRHVGEGRLRVRWPPRGRRVASRNAGSLVIGIRVAGRRLLLAADLDGPGLKALRRRLAGGAAICDLPHHGSFDAEAARWVRRLAPELALQSCGHRRLERDPWPAVLRPLGTVRRATARDGASWARIDGAGRVSWGRSREGVPEGAKLSAPEQ